MLRKTYKVLSIAIVLSISVLTSFYIISRTSVKYYYSLNPYDYREIKYTRGSTIDDIAVENTSGLYFEGWYQDKELTKRWDFDNNKVYMSTSLYAKWDKAHTVKLYDQQNVRIVQVKNGTNLLDVQGISEPINYQCTTCIFIGWYDLPMEYKEVAKKIDLDFMVHEDLNLYAHFSGEY